MLDKIDEIVNRAKVYMILCNLSALEALECAIADIEESEEFDDV